MKGERIMANHERNFTGDASTTIADDILDALNAASEVAHPQDPEVYQGLNRAWFRVTGPDGETYFIQVSKARPAKLVPGTKLYVGDRVRSEAAGATYALEGTVSDPRNALEGRIYVSWDGNVMPVGYWTDGPVAQGLVKV